MTRDKSAQRFASPIRFSLAAFVSVLLISATAIASAGSTATSPVRTHIGPPYAPANEGLWWENYTQGCGFPTIVSPSAFSNATGAGSAGIRDAAYVCPADRISQEVVQAGIYLQFPVNSSLGYVGIVAMMSIATQWAWNITTGTCAIPSNGSTGTCQAFTQFQDYAYIQLYDVTAGTAVTSTEFLGGSDSPNVIGYCRTGVCSPWSNTTTSFGSHSFSPFKFVVHGNLKSSHTYELTVQIGTYARTWLSSTGSATLSGAHGWASGTIRLVVSSISLYS